MAERKPTMPGIIDPSSIQPHLLYSTQKASEFLGMSTSTLRYLGWCGRIKSRKIGRRTYILGKELLRFIGEPVDEKAPSSTED